MYDRSVQLLLAPAAMRPQYAVLVALFLDSVDAISILRDADTHSIGNRIEKRTNDTVIPAPINVEPSQYWEGNDGPWFVKSIGQDIDKLNH